MNFSRIILLSIFTFLGCAPVPEPLDGAPSYPIQDTVLHTTVEKYCVDCHNPDKREGNLDLASVVDGTLNDAPYLWQDVAWVIQNQEMPPKDAKDAPRPNQETYLATSDWLNQRLASEDQSHKIFDAFSPEQAMLDVYCMNCHNDQTQKGDVNLAKLQGSNFADHPEMWEEVLRKVNARQMPPKDRKRPNEKAYEYLITEMSEQLDSHHFEDADLGKIETFRRLTRAEYKNSIRDLLALNIDVSKLLPSDQESFGFDNTTMSNLSATLLERYITAAQKISQQVIGLDTMQPDGSNYRNRPDQSQESHVQGLPIGTVGGMLVEHHFPVTGNYRVDVRLSRDRDEKVEGLHQKHQMEILVNDALKKSIEIAPAKNYKNYHFDESNLFAELNIPAGTHKVGVTFPSLSNSLPITKRKPFNVAFNLHRHPRQTPGIYEVSITGPYHSDDISAEIPKPQNKQENEQYQCSGNDTQGHYSCAEETLSKIARRAYRRPLNEQDISNFMNFYQQGYQTSSQQDKYQTGLQKGLAAILVNPNFLFKIETPPANLNKDVYALNDHELAARLSFFLWNSIPDTELIELAEQQTLHKPEVLKQQVVRMLQDKKSQTMLHNFVEQWLHLRNIDSFTPDTRAYPDFDHNLREAMKQETLLFVNSILLSEQSVMDLLSADYSYLNERLAKHYDIPHVYGSRFRKVNLPQTSNRGGLLRQSSILAVTSYANRTSPVLRGNWILENIIGTPTPPPPADVPSLENSPISESLPVRIRLAKHREDPACAGCHNLMDPPGFAFENYDAVGQWRDTELGHPVDATAGLPDGKEFVGAQGLIDGLLTRPELFVQTLSEKLMTFALGRGLTHSDAPQIRAIIKQAKANNYQFSSIVSELVLSPQFKYKQIKPESIALANTVQENRIH
ncbi:DUF1592 domain-containing protein [Paraglaciecola sp.]|uniref:DUF1592 domain-containing protein n=1 Tax=Paraglaciecola sp. TaxID=1920173 RepID=UPI003EF379AC